MILKVSAFGIARDILGAMLTEIEISDRSSVKDLKMELDARYPSMLGLDHYFIAVNEEYAEDDKILKEEDTIVIIPPVSGG